MIQNMIFQTGAGKHVLPPLPYGYSFLEPVIDSKTLMIHHDRHHKAYVDGLNKAELALSYIRQKGLYDYIKYWEEELAFQGSGHILHSIYWTIMTNPAGSGNPGQRTMERIAAYFGSFNALKAQFIAAARTVEGSGWEILAWNPAFGHLEILQCGRHENLTQWGSIPVLVCDVWEHAYYLKYQNLRPDYIEGWWSLINWAEVESRLILAQNGQLRLSME